MSNAAQLLLTLAALATALGALWRFLHLGELLRGTRLFLLDWLGTPARPGAEAVPPFPERMALVERRTADLAHDFRGELTSRLTLLAYTVDRTHAAATNLTERLSVVEDRVAAHRRRNDEQIELLRAAIARTEERLAEVQARAAYRRAEDDDRQRKADKR